MTDDVVIQDLTHRISEVLIWAGPAELAWPPQEDWSNEYEGEAEEIARALIEEKPRSIERVAALVADVFREHLGMEWPTELYAPIAKQVFKAYEAPRLARRPHRRSTPCVGWCSPHKEARFRRVRMRSS